MNNKAILTAGGNISRHMGFQNLMRHRVHNILLVSSLYDSYILSKDAGLNEMLISEFMELNLFHSPEITRKSNAGEALDILRHGPRFNLIITTANIGDMPVAEFVSKIKEDKRRAPVVLLTFDERELADLQRRRNLSKFDHVFLWQGDFRILLAIVKLVEDRLNLAHDTREMGVQVILLVEDNVHFYSRYLPLIYSEVMNQSQNLLSEGLNLPHKLLRMRARPKIIHCMTFEKAWELFRRYEKHILGVITDVEFKMNGVKNPHAGEEFTKRVKQRDPEMPVMLQSFQAHNAEVAKRLNVSFVRKDSPTLLNKLRDFMSMNFGFGDFVFRDPDGTEIGWAHDLQSLEQMLRAVPIESILYHGARDHFSTWLKARTEFDLARRLKPRKISDYATPEDLRKDLINSIQEFRREQLRGVVMDFDPEKYDITASFARIGRGSLGGKARGLAFVSHLLESGKLWDSFDGVRISIPPTVVISTDLFDEFLEKNNLMDFALQEEDDKKLIGKFLEATLPERLVEDLRRLLRLMSFPLAVRSSSLLEDSQYQPFAGIYQTYMIPNNDRSLGRRLKDLEEAIKRVYASTYSSLAKRYIQATSYRLDEEKMAVIVQRVVGAKHSSRFYPNFAGVAKSHNFYPTKPMKPSDGIVSVALGLGRMVVEGGRTVRFCPKYPQHMLQFGTVEDILQNTQKDFYALDLKGKDHPKRGKERLESAKYGLDVAEKDGTLTAVGSVYSPNNDAVYDGISRQGVRLVTFAPVLKHSLFPLPEICDVLLDIGRASMGRPVEMEFAVNLVVRKGEPSEFVILQIRPMVLNHEPEEIRIENIAPERMICSSSHVLGQGHIDNIYDVVVVDVNRFERAKSRQVAEEVGRFNAKLREENRPYLLIGVGRWGTADPWLGIPVVWSQVDWAKVIVEAGFRDFKVTPSQGAHFFQNLTSLRVGFFTVNPDLGEGFLDWEWLNEQPAVEELPHVRHLRFEHPVVIKMNGFRNQGVICKPEG